MAFTLAHLSDPHLAPLPKPRWRELIGKRLTGYINWQRSRRFIHDSDVLAKIAADMKAQAPSHIAVTGDIANIALPEEFTRGRDWLQSLGPPDDVSFVLGNHDIYVSQAAPIAMREWGDYMSGDGGARGFPYLRRRGPFSALLEQLRGESLFRVVMLHHPPVSPRPANKRLVDAAEFLRVIAAHGAELVLHGHDHLHMLNWLSGPNGARVPAVGVPSASAAPGTSRDAAAYNLYAIDGAPGAWRCEMTSRGITSAGAVMQQRQLKLLG